tara:strand:- start:297 stop:476 length:180 start_codon:yes stop_codon:yes gene_type:complete
MAVKWYAYGETGERLRDLVDNYIYGVKPDWNGLEQALLVFTEGCQATVSEIMKDIQEEG